MAKEPSPQSWRVRDMAMHLKRVARLARLLDEDPELAAEVAKVIDPAKYEADAEALRKIIEGHDR